MSPVLVDAETEQAQASVRGWNMSGIYENGGDFGCCAQVDTRADTWRIDIESAACVMSAPSGQYDNLAGGVVQIDRRVIDARVDLAGGCALRQVRDRPKAQIGALQDALDFQCFGRAAAEAATGAHSLWSHSPEFSALFD